MLTKLLTTKVLGWSSAILALLLVAALAFASIQTSRLSTANEGLKAAKVATTLLIERVNSDRQLIAGRDALITKQNLAVAQLVKDAQADRTAYLTRIAAADKVAKTHEASATTIMARQIKTTDELQRSRAALALIKEMLAAEGPR